MYKRQSFACAKAAPFFSVADACIVCKEEIMRENVIGVILLFPLLASATEVVFEGYPVKKIETNENSSNTSLQTETQSAEYKVTVIKDGENIIGSPAANFSWFQWSLVSMSHT